MGSVNILTARWTHHQSHQSYTTTRAIDCERRTLNHSGSGYPTRPSGADTPEAPSQISRTAVFPEEARPFSLTVALATEGAGMPGWGLGGSGWPFGRWRVAVSQRTDTAAV